MSEKFQLVLDVAQKAQVPLLGSSPGGVCASAQPHGGPQPPEPQAWLVCGQPTCPQPARRSLGSTHGHGWREGLG